MKKNIETTPSIPYLPIRLPMLDHHQTMSLFSEFLPEATTHFSQGFYMKRY